MTQPNKRKMTEKTCYTIKDYLRKVRLHHQRGLILSSDDIAHALLTTNLRKTKIYCICIDPITKNMYPSLSIFWNGVQAERALTTSDVKNYLGAERLLNENSLSSARSDWYCITYGWYRIYSPKTRPALMEETPGPSLTEKTLRALARVCELVRVSSFNMHNALFKEVHGEIIKFQQGLHDQSIATLTDVCKFIRMHWHVHANILAIPPTKLKSYGTLRDVHLTFDHKILEKLARKTTQEPIHRHLLNEVNKTGNPVGGSMQKKNKTLWYLIYPVAQKINPHTVVREHIVLWSFFGIRQNVAAATLECIDSFIVHKTVRGKTRNIIELNNRIIDAAISDRGDSWRALEDQFKEICSIGLRGISNTTLAYSVVLRIYNAATHSLDVFEEFCPEWGARDAETPLLRIPLSKHNGSMNAFTFIRGTPQDPFFYIPDTRNIPYLLREKGLKEVLHARSRSRSEVCCCLFSGKVPFAVLNVESEIKNAFDYEIDYILAVKQALEQFQEVSTKSRDTRWLAEGSGYYQMGHELENLIYTSAFDEDQRKLLAPYLLSRLMPEHSQPMKLGSLVDQIQDWIASLDSPTNSKKARNVLDFKISSSDDMMISSAKFHRMFLIVQNFLTNVLVHGSEADSLLIERHPKIKYKTPSNPCLEIKYSSVARFEENVLNLLAVAPIRGRKRYRYGMFLVGVWARSMGGLVQVCTTGSTTVIDVRLPLLGD